MRQALLVVDIQTSFKPPEWLIREAQTLASSMASAATIELHDETVTPFQRQLGWAPSANDTALVTTGKVFIKHGYLPPPGLIAHLKELEVERVLVCGIQAETCVLGVGFALFDAGLQPTLVPWLTVGSSLDPSGQLGARLWKHHFGRVLSGPYELLSQS